MSVYTSKKSNTKEVGVMVEMESLCSLCTSLVEYVEVSWLQWAIPFNKGTYPLWMTGLFALPWDKNFVTIPLGQEIYKRIRTIS